MRHSSPNRRPADLSGATMSTGYATTAAAYGSLACETVAKSASAALIWQPPRQSRDDKKRPRPREAGGADPKRAICLARITGQMAYLLTVRPASIGREACRERVCQYGELSVGDGSIKKKKTK